MKPETCERCGAESTPDIPVREQDNGTRICDECEDDLRD